LLGFIFAIVKGRAASEIASDGFLDTTRESESVINASGFTQIAFESCQMQANLKRKLPHAEYYL
jgi:hypothetical protein